MWGQHLELLHPVERLVNLPQSLDREELTGSESGLSFFNACHVMDSGERVALMAALLVEQDGPGELNYALSAERDVYGSRHVVTSRVV